MKCSICLKSVERYFQDQKGNIYCSEACFEETFPKCSSCNVKMKQWIEFNGKKYCSEKCAIESTNKINEVLLLSEITGLYPDEIQVIAANENWSMVEFAENIDELLDALENQIPISGGLISAYENAGVFNRLATNLSSYNTMRGGRNGFKGFVFEELHAANSSSRGISTEVISNNGIADFMILNPDGTRTPGQAKLGYNTKKIDWSAYEGQQIIIDKGNTKLINSAKEAGMDVIESNITNH